jgi:protein gp37
MAQNSRIEWTDVTWNPIRGCSVISPGCKNCYAMKQAHRFSGPGGAYEGLTQLTSNGPVWTGKVQFVEKHLADPLKWKKPRMIFVNSMSDLFHEGISDEQIDKIFAVMALCPQHTFQILTKRPERMLKYLTAIRREGPTKGYVDLLFGRPARAFPVMFSKLPLNNETIAPWPLPNVWLGVSAESQKYADERIPLLLQTPAAVRWVSAEPLLGPIDLTDLPVPSSVTGYSEKSILETPYRFNVLTNQDDDHVYNRHPKINWLVAGSESGPGARPAHPDWFRGLRDQCKAAGVPFFFKQWGEWKPAERGDPDFIRESGGFQPDSHTHNWDKNANLPDGLWSIRVGKKAAGRLLDGKEHNEYPALKAEVAA